VRVLREPLFRFFLLGAGLFALYAALEHLRGQPVTLSGSGLVALLEEYEALTGEAPDAQQRQAIIEDYYRREVLYREGLRERIFESDGRLREAIIERMQQQVSGELPEPSERDLVSYYTDHMDRYYREPLVTVDHRYLATDPGDDAAALLAGLAAGEAPAFDAAPGGERLTLYGESMLRAQFGSEILDVLRNAPSGRWIGPLESRRGWHFLRVRERRAAEPLPFVRARDQVLADYQAEVLAERIAAYVDARRERYPLDLSAELIGGAGTTLGSDGASSAP
jgi:parvulin-like peptidyl-prolyl isomerase